MMNPVPLFLIIVTLPLLLGGCGSENQTAKQNTKLIDPSVGVESKELELREGVHYLKGSDTPYTGKSFDLTLRGRKISERSLKEGKLNGLSISYHRDGKKRSETIFKNGKFDGLLQRWHENGTKWSEGIYKDGKRDGLISVWNQNGNKASEATYKDDKKEGLSVSWYPNGQKASEVTYKDGEVVKGSKKWWNSKGEPVGSLKEAKAE